MATRTSQNQMKMKMISLNRLTGRAHITVYGWTLPRTRISRSHIVMRGKRVESLSDWPLNSLKTRSRWDVIKVIVHIGNIKVTYNKGQGHILLMSRSTNANQGYILWTTRSCQSHVLWMSRSYIVNDKVTDCECHGYILWVSRSCIVNVKVTHCQGQGHNEFLFLISYLWSISTPYRLYLVPRNLFSMKSWQITLHK